MATRSGRRSAPENRVLFKSRMIRLFRYIALGRARPGASAGLEIALPFVRMLLLSRALSLERTRLRLGAGRSPIRSMTRSRTWRFIAMSTRKNAQISVRRWPERMVCWCFAGCCWPRARWRWARDGVAVRAFRRRGRFRGAGGAAADPRLRTSGAEGRGARLSLRPANARRALRRDCVAAGALTASLALGRGHGALTASLYGLALGQTAASHVFAGAPYRLCLSGPGLRQGAAVRRAADGQWPRPRRGRARGPRVVGALLGPEALGSYAVAMLAVVVPITLVQRLMGALAGGRALQC